MPSKWVRCSIFQAATSPPLRGRARKAEVLTAIRIGEHEQVAMGSVTATHMWRVFADTRTPVKPLSLFPVAAHCARKTRVKDEPAGVGLAGTGDVLLNGDWGANVLFRFNVRRNLFR